MNDQKKLWDDLHTKGRLKHTKDRPTDFAKEIQRRIPVDAYILELGCGVGNDSYYFAKKGHRVLATDFSEVAIENDKKNFQENNLTFEVLDMSKVFPFMSETFDVVYVRLSLHYFTDKKTKEIFKDMYRILKISGLICFICKSTDDPKYGKGTKIEKDMFDKNGHIRHFFSREYAKECLGEVFKIEQIEEGEDYFYNDKSAYIKVIATKI